MNSLPVFVKNYPAPPVNQTELLLRCGCKEADGETAELIAQCINEARGRFSYRVCYSVFPLTVENGMLNLSFAKTKSAALSKNLKGCEKAVIFAATVGLEADRLIAKYAKTSPAKALIFQAIGAERIESLCDAFCEDIGNTLHYGESLRPRFSPGYGDLPLSLQKDIFSVLDCPRKIGLTLNSSLLMSPTKSVTAIVGIAADR